MSEKVPQIKYFPSETMRVFLISEWPPL
jgi:hypothetical protein